MKAKIISSVDDKIGMIFYNTKTFDNSLGFHYITISLGFHHITTIYSLDSPSADRIKNCLKIQSNFDKDYQLA